MNDKLSVATSQTVTDKSKGNPGGLNSLGAGWLNQELSRNELAEHIRQGFPFTAQHDGERRQENFTRTNIVSVDIDKGMTLAEALAHPYVQQYGTMIYTTASHTDENNRFRVMFQTERPITSVDDMRAAYVGAIRMLGGDGSCHDACRLWFGSMDCQIFMLGNVLPSVELDKMIALGVNERTNIVTVSATGRKKSTAVPQRISVPTHLIQTVKLARGGMTVSLTSLEAGTPIYCPIHADSRPSAVVTRNKQGVHGLYCASSTCRAVYWPIGTKWIKRAPFDFDAVNRAVRQLAAEELPSDDLTNTDDEGNLIEPTAEDIAAWQAEMDARSFITTNCKFVPDLPMTDGITFLSSIKGSGKTEWIKKIVEEAKQKGLSVLLIGHRQSLLQSMSARVGLDCYFYHADGKLKNNVASDYYAVCMDSMVKLLDPEFNKYHVIIIDESEQVITHSTQSTLDEKRRPTIKMLEHYLDVAKSVVYCDADLGSITVELASQTASATTPIRFVLNEYKPEGKSIDLYKDENHLIAELVEAVRKGGTHYVATNSKGKAKELHDLMLREFPDLLARLVTSDQATDPDNQDFIANITKVITNYGLVIASPSLGTGVDITFEGNEQKIDTVFGFFIPNVNTHFDLDQQLARVRHAKAIRAWITPQRFNFETDATAIGTELIKSKEANDAIVGFTREGVANVDRNYLDIYAQVTAIRRASMNDLRGNFIRYKERLGWQVNRVEPVATMADVGKQLMNAAKKRVKAEEERAVLGAKQISRSDYDTLKERKRSQKLSLADQDAMRRFEAESFYRQTVTEELLRFDNQGRSRDVVRMAGIYLTGHDEAIDDGYLEASNEGKKGLFVSDAQNSALKRKVVHTLLKSAGLADGWRPINPDVAITQDGLRDFVTAMVENKSKLEHLFGMTLHRELEEKPVTSVGKVLALIGLKLVKHSTKNIGGDKKIRYYKVCLDSLKAITEIVELRAESKTNSAMARPKLKTRTSAIDWGKAA